MTRKPKRMTVSDCIVWVLNSEPEKQAERLRFCVEHFTHDQVHAKLSEIEQQNDQTIAERGKRLKEMLEAMRGQ